MRRALLLLALLAAAGKPRSALCPPAPQVRPEITVSWVASTDAVFGYCLTKAPTPTATFAALTCTAGPATSYTDYAVAQGVQSCYRVRAYVVAVLRGNFTIDQSALGLTAAGKNYVCATP